MKRIIAVLGIVLAMSFVGLAQDGEMAKKQSKKAEKSMPKGDAEIQKCIADKFSNSEKLKSQGFSASVSNGEATLTGNANNAGSKGAATRIAKNCGAQKVTNNITAPAVKKKSGDKNN